MNIVIYILFRILDKFIKHSNKSVITPHLI